MDANDPRTWPAELIAHRNLAMAAALGDRVDPAARAALASWQDPRTTGRRRGR